MAADSETIDDEAGRIIPRSRRGLSDPGLTALLILNTAQIFVVSPLGAMGYRLPEIAAFLLLATQIVLILILSPSRRAAIAVGLSLTLSIAAVVLGRIETPGPIHAGLEAGGQIVGRLTVCWVLLKAVFGPGRVNLHRILGAVTLYLNIGLAFASVYLLIAGLSDGAFVSDEHDQMQSMGTMVYFSFTTLSSVGFGDIRPIQPFARSVANLESIIGQLFPATLLARIVTLELTHRAERNGDR